MSICVRFFERLRRALLVVWKVFVCLQAHKNLPHY